MGCPASDGEGSEFLFHTPCESCGSSDANSVYSDGHTYCFACQHRTSPGHLSAKPKGASTISTTVKFIEGLNFGPISARKLSAETCRKWHYGIGTYKGKPCQVANFYRDNRLVFQKIRFADKTFASLGDIKEAGLYGQHLWPRGSAKKIVVTEGEIDALSVSQMQGHKWPAVSIPNGAEGALKVFKRELEYLESFDEVILMFDQDEPGIEAAKECAAVLSPGKAKIAQLGLKDANELLKAGRGAEIINAVWNAGVYRPDGIVSGAETWDAYSKRKNTPCVPYPWSGLNSRLKGIRLGEMVTVTAGTGIGKSTLCRELAYYLATECHERVGYVALEESVGKSVEAFLSLELDTPLHLRTCEDEEAERAAWEKLFGGEEMIYLYDHWGSMSLDALMSRLRYLAVGCGCKYIFLDHISIVVSGIADGDERRMLDNIATQLRAFTENTQIALFVVVHLKRPGDKGKSHEEGGRVHLSDLRGSGAIAQLSDTVIALERDQQAEDEQGISVPRVLKNRFSGDVGRCSPALQYNPDTGRMLEAKEEMQPEQEAF